MKRSVLCMILILLSLFTIFSGCQQKQDDGKPYDSAYYDASQFYLQYMESLMDDPTQVTKFCYFVDESDKEALIQEMQEDPVISYEIIRFEKLSDSLWVIELCMINDMHKNGVYFVNYVGITDNNMLVYRNKRYLPAELTDGLEIEDYEPHGPDILEGIS